MKPSSTGREIDGNSVELQAVWAAMVLELVVCSVAVQAMLAVWGARCCMKATMVMGAGCCLQVGLKAWMPFWSTRELVVFADAVKAVCKPAQGVD